MGQEPERAGGHRFVIRQCRRANDDVTTRALNLKNLKLRHSPHALTIFARLVVDSTRQF